MILITGGIGSGKRSFVIDDLGYRAEDLSADVSDDSPVFYGLHDLIRERGSLNEETRSVLLRKEVVVCDEVGCGVVPLDEQVRKWRDEVGRAQTSLATEASTVIRMVCGIPQLIKGRLESMEN